MSYSQTGSKITKTLTDGSVKDGDYFNKDDMKIVVNGIIIWYYKKSNDPNFFKKESFRTSGTPIYYEDDEIKRTRFKMYPAQDLIDDGWIPYAKYRPLYTTRIASSNIPASITMDSAYLDNEFCITHTMEEKKFPTPSG